MSEATVAAYLKQRLEELGLERLFVVAGNYTAPFLDTILEDPRSPMVMIMSSVNQRRRKSG
jgi:indolepyruvate decarboxylase